MFDSIKSWITTPVTVKPYTKRSATGDKLFGTPYEVLCYPVGEVDIVRNWQGVEVVSNTKLYMEGSTTVTKFDNIIFEDEERPVQAISSYYRNGAVDIKVVYV